MVVYRRSCADASRDETLVHRDPLPHAALPSAASWTAVARPALLASRNTWVCRSGRCFSACSGGGFRSDHLGSIFSDEGVSTAE